MPPKRAKVQINDIGLASLDQGVPVGERHMYRLRKRLLGGRVWRHTVTGHEVSSLESPQELAALRAANPQASPWGTGMYHTDAQLAEVDVDELAHASEHNPKLVPILLAKKRKAELVPEDFEKVLLPEGDVPDPNWMMDPVKVEEYKKGIKDWRKFEFWQGGAKYAIHVFNGRESNSDWCDFDWNPRPTDTEDDRTLWVQQAYFNSPDYASNEERKRKLGAYDPHDEIISTQLDKVMDREPARSLFRRSLIESAVRETMEALLFELISIPDVDMSWDRMKLHLKYQAWRKFRKEIPNWVLVEDPKLKFVEHFFA